MIVNKINPVLFELGPFTIKYYGLFFASAFLLSYFIIKYLIKKQKKIPLKSEKVDELFIYILLGSILGGRFFYCLFYNFSYYLKNPLNIFFVWNGGMSFHGGFIGAIFAVYCFVYFYNKKNKTNANTYTLHFFDLADLLVIPLSLGLALGRLGNFTNHELYGRITDVPWAVKFKNVAGLRHPSQIYESLKNLFIFSILWWMKDIKNLPRGMLFGSFTLLYGILRFIIEFFRQPDVQMGDVGFYFGWLTAGQILCSVMIIFGVVVIYLSYKKDVEKLE